MKTDPFNEVVRTAAEISGAWIVGFAAVGRQPPRDAPAQVAAMIPQSWSGDEACLRVTSVDGLYESENTYEIAGDWGGGWTALVYPSGHLQELSGMTADRLAPILLKGPCGGESSDVGLVQWGSNTSGVVSIYLNTNRADEAYVSFPEAPALEDVVCSQVEAANRNAFDMICTIPAPAVGQAALAISVLTFKNGEMGRELDATLHFPPPT